MNGRLQNLELALGTAEDVEDTAEVAGWSGLLDRVARLETLTVVTQVGSEFLNFGCESSPISRNVRSFVHPCVRALVSRQMQSKAY